MTNWDLSLPAPAKINLFLHITGQRDDGYHELQTAFQFLDLSDTLHFSYNVGEITLESPLNSVPITENLIYKAATALKSATGCQQGANIRLVKQLPMGGGLGGGSSDAATTLLALNKLWELQFSMADLATIGLKLGADVPVFIHGHAAWAEGIGEQLHPINLDEPWYLLIHPGCHVSTGQIFSSKQLTRDTQTIKIRAFLEGSAVTRNDCEPVVRQLYQEVDEAITWLKQFSNARMTGTGACIFAAFRGANEAREVLQQLPSKWSGFICKGLNKSPLQKQLALC